MFQIKENVSGHREYSPAVVDRDAGCGRVGRRPCDRRSAGNSARQGTPPRPPPHNPQKRGMGTTS